MKKALFLLLILFVCGCGGQQTLVLNKPYDEVYVKTIRFAYEKGWQVTYENKEARVIDITLAQYSKTDLNVNEKGEVMPDVGGSVLTSTNRLTLMFTPQGDKTEVTVTADNPAWVYWNPDETVKEYKAYIEKD